MNILQKEQAEAIAAITKDQVYKLMMDVELFNELDSVVTFDDAKALVAKTPKNTEIERLAFAKMISTGKEYLKSITDFSVALSFFNNARHLGDLELSAIEKMLDLSTELLQYCVVYSVVPENHPLREQVAMTIEKIGRQKLSAALNESDVFDVLKHALPGSRLRAETIVKLAEFL